MSNPPQPTIPQAKQDVSSSPSSHMRSSSITAEGVNDIARVLQIKLLYYKRGKQGPVNFDVVSSLLLKVGIDDPVVHYYMCRYYDKDYNGVYSYIELFNFIRSVRNSYKEFTEADENKDRTISPEEISNVYKHLEMILSKHVTGHLMRIFDVNQNKSLSLGEFLLLYVFLLELKHVHESFKDTKKIGPEQLCKLLDDHDKEERVASVLEAIFCKYSLELTLDAFARVIVCEKDKIPPLKKPRHAPHGEHIHYGRGMSFEYTKNWEDKHTSALVEPSLNEKIVWRHVHEIHPQAAFFKEGIDPGDVIQGSLPNCWFLGALAVVAAGAPDKIRGLFLGEKNGSIKCKFYHGGEWENVIIDDRLPCFAQDAKSADPLVLYYASCLDRSEFWVPLIEKAYAKLHGSYAALEYGDVCEALKDLTGHATQTILISEYNIDSQWESVMALFNEKCLMGCATSNSATNKDEIKAMGLWESHAYSILKFLEVDNVRFVLLRNPWGRLEWNGDWSDYSPKWTAEWKKKFGKGYNPNKDDGKFYMCFEDFVKYFKILFVSYTQFHKPKRIIKGQWQPETAMGCHNHPYWFNNPRYVIRTKESDTTILVSLTQPNFRRIFGKSFNTLQSKIPKIGMYLVAKTEEDYKTLQVTKILQRTEFTATRDISLKYFFEEPSTSVVLPCTFEPNETGNFTIEVYSNKHVEIEEIQPAKKQSIIGRWKPTSTEKNLAYMLQCSEDGTVDIALAPLDNKNADMTVIIYEQEEQRERTFKLRQSINDRSTCISLNVQKNVEYIIEPSAQVTSIVDFEISVFSEQKVFFAAYSYNS